MEIEIIEKDVYKYRGYIIELDERNTENDEEILCNIYNSYEDYKNFDYDTIVSLYVVGIEENIKEYIDEYYY